MWYCPFEFLNNPRSRRRWEGNIRIDLKEIGSVGLGGLVVTCSPQDPRFAGSKIDL